MFALGKAFKYFFWLNCGLISYHFYLVRKKEKPEEQFLSTDFYLEIAKKIDWHLYDLKLVNLFLKYSC
jgi:hypothetical protein